MYTWKVYLQKEYLRTTGILIPIIQNISYCNGQPKTVRNNANSTFEALYFVVRPYISPIFALYIDVPWLAGRPALVVIDFSFISCFLLMFSVYMAVLSQIYIRGKFQFTL